MAKFNMLLMALTRGASVAMHAKGHGRATKWLSIVVEFTRLFFIPILYQGCFHLYETLSNPWGEDMNDFPEEEFESAIQKECIALTGAAARGTAVAPEAGPDTKAL